MGWLLLFRTLGARKRHPFRTGGALVASALATVVWALAQSLVGPVIAHAAVFNCSFPCTPPALYSGGAIVHYPRVYLVFWGHLWTGNQSGVIAAQQTLFQNLAGLGANYNNILTNYYDVRDYAHNTTVLAGTWIDTNDPVGAVGGQQTVDEAERATTANSWTDTSDTIYLILPQQGTARVTDLQAACGFHTYGNGASGAQYLVGTTIWADDPAGCRGKLDLPSASTSTSTHEYAETLTDPLVGTGWRTRDATIVEIGDLCQGLGQSTAVISGVGTVQLLYDNVTQTCTSSLVGPIVIPPRQEGMLGRYAGPSDHWTTSGAPSSSFSLEYVLGFSPESPTSLTTPLYECLFSDGVDHFSSVDPGCEGSSYKPLRLEGWLFRASAPAPLASTKVYRCRIGTDHFDSISSNCEGQTVDQTLGYALTEATLGRYARIGDHQSTSGQVDSRYQSERALGTLVSATTGGVGLTGLYNCLVNGVDYMLSTVSTCEGTQMIGLTGLLYATVPTGVATVPIYRCRVGTDHFVSNDSGCEGQTVEALMGYAKQSIALIRYNAVGGDHWSATTGVDDGHTFEAPPLGFLSTTALSGMTGLYSCSISGTHFSSQDSACEGFTVLALDGYIYSSAHVGALPLFRCRSSIGHFDTQSVTCENYVGAVNERTLGYVSSQE